ncbi:hypothetical protein BH09PLA1_BH09PLA1_22700 [soil metagenome]
MGDWPVHDLLDANAWAERPRRDRYGASRAINQIPVGCRE